jgi:phosphatidylglycerol lysyltransferase
MDVDQGTDGPVDAGPEYRPLYLAYPDPTALPRIGTAIGRAYLPDVGPRQFGRLVRTP